MDVDAGHGAAFGRALPASSSETSFTQRLRSLLSFQNNDDDPVAELARTHRSIHTSADVAILRRSYQIAESMHRGQFRKSGDPYITHPLAVAQICAELGMDTTTLVAALLHDTVEDTSYTLEALQGDFGNEVAHLVDGVTKFDKAYYGKAAEGETIRKMIVAAGKDVRVLVIKLADRLHNMRTLGARGTASRARIATATLDVLVPLCDRLGIQALKRSLDDVVLFHLEPDSFARIDEHVKNRPGWDDYLADVSHQARVALRRQKVTAEVTPRPRHYYSIWKDTVAGNHPVPFDLPRIAVIVDGPDTDCYAALGAIHGRWRPVAGRFKDFIASPKNNLYRSLHTTVVGPDGKLVEVLIRTQAMHRYSEYGVATSYRYPKESDEPAGSDQLTWLKRVLDWQQDTTDAGQFLDSLRCDLAEGQITVFAHGNAYELPSQSTPVDLAYELGPRQGDQCLAATINGRLAPLSSPLRDGDVVEIFSETENQVDVEPNAPRGPRKEWLGFVKSSQAQMQINRYFDERNEPGISIADKVRLGRATIGLTLRKHDRGLASEVPLRRLAEELGYPDLETLLVAVCERSLEPDAVVEQLIALVDHPD
ncbi:HD domain-containing protein [Actinoplanes sp. NEAU-A12]|uniref:HD domain-containing protein n=1 Tax=Actinoplanes sandaracinus TaxID=3045177 RepID=A0ABT6WE73_9ACTN|nr:HD domain-containing protein [Actinoplanes sandaracinus]MDI6097998.1 HD domain-containing protein [Actinoplanes sandaracinus]